MSIHVMKGVDLAKLRDVLRNFSYGISGIKRHSTETSMVRFFIVVCEQRMSFSGMNKTALNCYPESKKALDDLMASFDGDKKYNRALIIGAKQVLIDHGKWR